MSLPLIRLLVADDHPIVALGLDGMTFADTRILLVTTAKSFAELVSHLATTQVDVVLLDLNNMGVSPLVMVHELRARFPDVQIVIFSSALALAPELIAAGALGYVVKEDMLSHLHAAIIAAAAGQPYYSPLVQNTLDRTARVGRAAPFAPQEEIVLKLVGRSWTTKEMAAYLQIDGRTTQNYVTTLLRKTGCENRNQLAAWYWRHYEGRAE
jgi:DNA-binding NarL/FixJ family response regulator